MLYPQTAIDFYNSGIAYVALEQYQRAIEDLDQAIKIDPRNPFAYYNRGVAYEKLGKSKKAQLDLQKAMELGYETP